MSGCCDERRYFSSETYSKLIKSLNQYSRILDIMVERSAIWIVYLKLETNNKINLAQYTEPSSHSFCGVLFWRHFYALEHTF